ncbi:hypothetical protein IFR05_014141, partial [Cadophora sp. M221]
MRGQVPCGPSDEETEVAEVLEVLLNFEVDPRLTFNIRGDNEESNSGFPIDMSIEVRAGIDPRTSHVTSMNAAIPLHVCKRLKPTTTFRDLMKAAGWKNRDELLRLIDKNLALCASPINYLAAIAEIEEAEVGDTQEDQPSDTETEKSVEVSNLNTARHGRLMDWAYFWTSPILLLLVGLSGLDSMVALLKMDNFFVVKEDWKPYFGAIRK